jgi:hypothetical protein
MARQSAEPSPARATRRPAAAVGLGAPRLPSRTAPASRTAPLSWDAAAGSAAKGAVPYRPRPRLADYAICAGLVGFVLAVLLAPPGTFSGPAIYADHPEWSPPPAAQP